MSAYTKLRLETQDGVAVIAFTDDKTLNAMGMDIAGELRDALETVARGEPKARAVVITGEGRGFSSGANLTTRAGPGGGGADRDAGAGLEAVYNPLVTYIRDYPLPIVTAVNGPAAGVGCSLALMGDLIIAGESAYFLQAFRRIGLVPDGGSTYLLPRAIGRARAMEMVLLGDKVPAAEALAWGLINRVVPDADLRREAVALARRLAEGPFSLALTRKLMWDGLDAHWAAQLSAERHAQTTAGRSEDSAEGVKAFLEKRPAAFAGR